MAPPLLLSRPITARLVLAVIVPAAFGALCGVILGVDEAAYVILTLLGIIGGLAAGYEHRTGEEGALRGLGGGMLFGTFILLAGTLTDKEAKATLPDPQWLLPVFTTIFGVILGAIGGALRGRRERRRHAAA